MMIQAVAFLALALLAQAQEQPITFPNYTSINQTVKGFFIPSNVTTYMTMSRDACQVREMLHMDLPLNFGGAKFIYNNGSNALSATSTSRRAFAAFTRGGHATGHVYYTNGTALFDNNSDWMGSYVLDALNGDNSDNWARARASMAVDTLVYQIPLSYLMTEILSIAERIDPAGTTSSSGPIHALDEGFGIYVGVIHECAAWSVAEKTAPAFGTRSTCEISKANEAIIANFNDAQAAIYAGSASDYTAAQDNIIMNVKAVLVQNLIHSAYQAEVALGMSMRANKTARLAKKWADNKAKNLGMEGNKGSEALRLKEAASDAEHAAMYKSETLHTRMAEQYTAFRALGPFIYMVDEEAAMSMKDMLQWNAKIEGGHWQKVRDALQPLYSEMGITEEMVGTLGAPSSVTCPA